MPAPVSDLQIQLLILQERHRTLAQLEDFFGERSKHAAALHIDKELRSVCAKIEALKHDLQAINIIKGNAETKKY